MTTMATTTLDVLTIRRQTYLDWPEEHHPLKLEFFYPNGTRALAHLKERPDGTWDGVIARVWSAVGSKRWAAPWSHHITWDRARHLIIINGIVYPFRFERLKGK